MQKIHDDYCNSLLCSNNHLYLIQDKLSFSCVNCSKKGTVLGCEKCKEFYCRDCLDLGISADECFYKHSLTTDKTETKTCINCRISKIGHWSCKICVGFNVCFDCYDRKCAHKDNQTILALLDKDCTKCGSHYYFCAFCQTIRCLNCAEITKAELLQETPNTVTIDVIALRPSSLKVNCIYEEHNGGICAIERMSEKTFLTGDNDKLIKLWQIGKSKCVMTYYGSSGHVYAIQRIKNDQFLSCSMTPAEIHHWHLDKPSVVKTISVSMESITSMIVLKGDLVAVALTDIQIWSNETESQFSTCIGHKKVIYSMVKIDEQRIASASHDKTVKVWNWIENTLLFDFKFFSSWVEGLALVGQNLIAAGGADKRILLIDINNGRIKEEFTTEMKVKTIQHVGLNSLLVSGCGGAVEIWDFESKEQKIENSSAHTNNVFRSAILDQNTFVTGGWDTTVVVWNVI